MPIPILKDVWRSAAQAQAGGALLALGLPGPGPQEVWRVLHLAVICSADPGVIPLAQVTRAGVQLGVISLDVLATGRYSYSGAGFSLAGGGSDVVTLITPSNINAVTVTAYLHGESVR